ncbi:Diguanylate cyclase, GGDEF domain [Jiangella sp. DSM 45060]|nr:Diguanylate cyclase, GGDEF domain [Jiangella sp. DSM 45060]
MPGRKNRLLDAALAYAAAGVPVTPAHRVVPLDGGRAWRRRWECTCGLTGCPDPGAHPVGDARRVLSAELVAELWGGQEPPGLLISPSATIDIWRMPRELGALGLRLLEAQRPSIWPPLLHRPDGSWAACTRPLAEPVPLIETYGLRVEKLGRATYCRSRRPGTRVGGCTGSGRNGSRTPRYPRRRHCWRRCRPPRCACSPGSCVMRRTLLGRRDGEQRPDRHDRFPPPAQGRMSVAARDDPITGLVAWPAFHEALPGLLRRQLGDGRAVGLAIGDVDDLKTYVERVRSVDAGSFGHLAGNALMQQLGIVARAWLRESGPSDACLATFGGDEIVLLGLAADQRAFIEAVSGCYGTSWGRACRARCPSPPRW